MEVPIPVELGEEVLEHWAVQSSATLGVAGIWERRNTTPIKSFPNLKRLCSNSFAQGSSTELSVTEWAVQLIPEVKVQGVETKFQYRELFPLTISSHW